MGALIPYLREGKKVHRNREVSPVLVPGRRGGREPLDIWEKIGGQPPGKTGGVRRGMPRREVVGPIDKLCQGPVLLSKGGGETNGKRGERRS